MGKVAVGSQKAVRDICASFRVEAKDAAKKFKPKNARNKFHSYLSKVIGRTFQLVERNVTINGHDWDSTLRSEDEELEPRDRTILQQLKDKQLAVQEHVEAVAKHRTNTRREVLENVRDHLQDLAPPVYVESTLESELPPANTMEPEVELCVDEGRLKECFMAIGALTRTLPDLVNKYEQLHRVVLDQNRLKESAVEKALREQSGSSGAPILQQLHSKPPS